MLPSQVKDLLDYWFESCFNVDLLVMADMLFLFCKPLMLGELCYKSVNFRVEVGFNRPMNIWSASCPLTYVVYGVKFIPVLNPPWPCGSSCLTKQPLVYRFPVFNQAWSILHTFFEKRIFNFFSKSAAVSVEHQEPYHVILENCRSLQTLPNANSLQHLQPCLS